MPAQEELTKPSLQLRLGQGLPIGKMTVEVDSYETVYAGNYPSQARLEYALNLARPEHEEPMCLRNDPDALER